LRGTQQLGIFLYSFFEPRRLLIRQFPIGFLYGLGQPGEFQVRIGVPRCIKKVLKPGAPRNAVGIEPVGFHLKKLIIEALQFFRRNISCKEIARGHFVQEVACLFEVRDAGMQALQIDM